MNAIKFWSALFALAAFIGIAPQFPRATVFLAWCLSWVLGRFSRD